MALSDAELTACLHRRARRVLIEALAQLTALPPARKGARKLDVEIVHRALLLAVLRFVVLSLGRARGLFQRAEDTAQGRLFAVEHPWLDVQPIWRETELDWRFPDALSAARASFEAELGVGLQQDGVDFEHCPAESIGNLYELLLAEKIELGHSGFCLASADRRKQTGTFFTPRALTEVVVERALAPLLDRPPPIAVCDPAVGGGAFLVQVGRALAGSSVERGALVRASLYGVDINPVACAVAEAALCLFASDPSLSLAEAGKNVRAADALSLDFAAEFPEVFARGGFDLVIGNPPWVAYAGRAAKPLAPARKAYFAAHYTAAKGYPTLHGLFVECAARLTPRGTLALVVPSPIADLQGYRAVRRAVRAQHTPREPMIEFGQDAFESVTQPCFALIADARSGPSADLDREPERPFRLAERSRAASVAAEVAPPSALVQLVGLAPFPKELFGGDGLPNHEPCDAGALAASLRARRTSPLPTARRARRARVQSGWPALVPCARPRAACADALSPARRE